MKTPVKTIDDDIQQISEKHTYSLHLPGSLKTEEQEHFIKKNDPGLYRLTRLCGQFNEEFNKPQVLTLDKFEYFEPIFSKEASNRYSQSELNEISNEFYKSIDYYRPITVIYSEDDPLVLLTLPRIFTEFSSFKNVRDTQLSGLNERIGRKDPLLSRQTVKPLTQLIHDANFDEKNIEKLKSIRLETYDLFMRFRKTKELYKGMNEENKDGNAPSSNGPVDLFENTGFIED